MPKRGTHWCKDHRAWESADQRHERGPVVVATSSDGLADTFYVHHNGGDYPVMVRHSDGGVLCLVDDSRACLHVFVVDEYLRKREGVRGC
jgi:hypothetical protein